MKQNPEKWRAGVAIAWDVKGSSVLHRRQIRSMMGEWRDEHYTHSPRGVDTPKPSWYASHEAAWQETGLQHFNQAELLGVTLALQRAVDTLRKPPDSQSVPKPISRSVTILTDSKPAMWDLIGDNWHTNSVRTESEYWAIRAANTAVMLAEAIGYMRELRDMNVRVRISWVPGHMGVPGNEWVDGLSRFARISGSRFKGRCGWERGLGRRSVGGWFWIRMRIR